MTTELKVGDLVTVTHIPPGYEAMDTLLYRVTLFVNDICTVVEVDRMHADILRLRRLDDNPRAGAMWFSVYEVKKL